LNEHASYVHWDIILSTTQNEEAIRDVFIFAADLCKLEIRKLASADLLSQDGVAEKIGQAFEDKPDLTFDDLEALINRKRRLKDVSATQTNAISSIRVSSHKLDSMINIISELITTQARLALAAQTSLDNTMVSVAEDFEKLLRQLRDTSMEMCLIPLETLYTRFQRLVRDLSKGLGKEITLITEGGDTELDKSIIENLSDPILHLLRNSIDHGLEDTPTRIAAGKPAKGTIHLKSFYDGSRVVIAISDDGRGIDPVKIRSKAVEKALIPADAVLSDKEIINLIFLPGFSTADKVTEVSGRGVGMDVVQEKVKELRGEIDIDSVFGKGTTVTLKRPLSFSILDGLMVKVEDTFFVLPLAAVGKCYEIGHERLAASFNRLIVLDGEQTPFISLREDFQTGGMPPDIEQVITIQYDGQRVALIVDMIIGEYQAVLKPMTNLYKTSDAVFGATIMGDGTIALVLDVNRLVKEYTNKVLN